jgi:superfamily II DNA helicase RecQ
MQGKYQVIITSPENTISATHLKPFLTKEHADRSLKIIVDEAHSIKKWGESGFRKAWYEIGLVRAFVGSEVPFAAFSATLSPEALETVRKSLHINPHKHKFINIGNFRPNITWDVRHLTSTTKAISVIGDYLPPLPEDGEHLPLTIIFVNTRTNGHDIHWHLQQKLPHHLHHQLHLFHALLSERSKQWILHECMMNKKGVFICTEVAAMVIVTENHNSMLSHVFFRDATSRTASRSFSSWQLII